ncbi:MAG: hypothetical protein KAR05_10160 [Candidatus Omnitrophica bacterium]|nr:hypothetical protein [Candidatus Omnitrophota bacterium]
MLSKFSLLCAVLLITGCSVGSYSKVDVDKVTGVKTVTRFSAFFEGATVLHNGKVDVSTIVEVTKKNVPLPVGRSSTGSEDVLVDLKIYFSNNTERNIYFQLRSLHLVRNGYNISLLDEPTELRLIPKAVESVFVEGQKIQNNELSLTLELLYVENYEYKKKRVQLQRISLEAFKDRKGKI